MGAVWKVVRLADEAMVGATMLLLTAIAIVILTLMLVLSIALGLVKRLMVSLHPECTDVACQVHGGRVS